MSKRPWIMIAGPYTSGAVDAEARARNVSTLNDIAVAVWDKGHVSVIGVNAALPIIEAAGEDRFNEIMMPMSLALAERCDACLRTGGPSQGADDDAQSFEARGLPVYRSIDEVPYASDAKGT